MFLHKIHQTFIYFNKKSRWYLGVCKKHYLFSKTKYYKNIILYFQKTYLQKNNNIINDYFFMLSEEDIQKTVYKYYSTIKNI